MAAPAQVVLSRIVGTVSQPQTDHIRANLLSNMNAFDYVLNCSLPNRLVEMAQAAEAIRIILKEVWIHGTDTQAELAGVFLHRTPIVFSVPGNVNGDAWTRAGDLLNLGRVLQLLAQISGRSWPMKDLEARPRITIAPRGSLNIELLHGRNEIVKI